MLGVISRFPFAYAGVRPFRTESDDVVVEIAEPALMPLSPCSVREGAEEYAPSNVSPETTPHPGRRGMLFVKLTCTRT